MNYPIEDTITNMVHTFRIEKSMLKHMLQKIDISMTKKTNKYLFIIKNTNLTIKSSNDYNGVSITNRIYTISKGLTITWLLEGDTLLKALKYVSSTLITFEVNNNTLSILFEEQKFKVSSNIYKNNLFFINNNDLPIKSELTIPANELLENLNAISFMLSKDMLLKDSSPKLRGVYFYYDNNIFTCTASNGFILAEYNTKKYATQNREFVIPIESIKLLIKFLTYQKDNVISIGYNDKLINDTNPKYNPSIVKFFAEWSKTEFSSIITTAKYPDYKYLLKDDSNQSFMKGKKYLLNAINELQEDNKDIPIKEKYIQFNLTTNQLELRTIFLTPGNSTNVDLTNKKIYLPISYEGIDITIAFNITYLISILEHIEEGDILFRIIDHKSKVLINNYSSEYQYILMPIKY